jgi:type II secretion system protein D
MAGAATARDLPIAFQLKTVVNMTRQFRGYQVSTWVQAIRKWSEGKPTAAIVICALVCTTRPLSAQVSSATTPVSPRAAEGSSTVVAYPVGERDVAEATRQLRQQVGQRSDVRIAPDPAGARVLVQAPPQVQHELQQQWHAPSAGRGVALSDPARPTASAVEANSQDARLASRQRREVSDQLRNITWRQLIDAAQRMSTNRLVLTPDANGQELAATLPARQGETLLKINTHTGAYRLEGTPQLTDAWLRAIRALDKRSSTPFTQLVPLGDVSVESVQRAVSLIEDAQRRAAQTSPSAPWGADVVGIRPRGRAEPPRAMQLAQATGQPPAQPDDAPVDQPDQPLEDQPEVEDDAAEPPAVGVDGSLIGPVQIEYVEGLDAIIIRGRRADVDRVMSIIEDLERIGGVPPAIELVDLQHVNSQSMAELVTQLNEQALAVRLGTVSITPLVKPNALLLIGRRESVDATVELINRLDQPVAPTSQFSIFRLRHLPAIDAAQTVTTFFAERGGLGPRILAQADFRTNSLIVYASPRDMQEVRQLLQELDVTDNAATSEVRVFKLSNALAEELAPMLEATLRGEAAPTPAAQPDGPPGAAAAATPTGTAPRSSTLTWTRIDAERREVLRSGILTEVRVAADVRANSLIVTAPADSMELIAALIEELDRLPTSEAYIKVFTIVNGDAFSLRAMLEELFGLQQQQAGQFGQVPSPIGAGESSLVPLRFSTDPRTNSIIATGSPGDLQVVEAILLRLGQDEVSQRINEVYRLQNAPAVEVAAAINQFLITQRQLTFQLAPETVSPFEQIQREVVVVPEIISNSLIISATPRYFEEIRNLVEEIDERPPMVMIQVLIASVQLGNTSELGVELGLQDSLLFDRSVIANNALIPGFNFNNLPLGNSNSPASLATRENLAGQGLTSFSVNRTNSNLGYGGLVLSASSESINILIRALQQTNRLDILSAPTVTTLNNQPAFVQVGQQVPIVTDSSLTQFGQTNTVQLYDVGILLGVTPRISPDGLVSMEIDAVNSELSPEGIPISISAEGDVLEQPIIDTTRAQTTVSARNGQTVVLGGLITKSRSTLTRSVPYLGDIPVLGNLFRFDSIDEQRSELLIIMTPHIVRNPEDMDAVNAIATQRMSWCLADVFDVYGDIGASGTGPDVIYPDQTPTVNEMLPQTPEEMPGARTQPRPPAPAPPRAPLPDNQPDDSIPFLQPGPDQGAASQSGRQLAGENKPQRRWRDRLTFGRSRKETAESVIKAPAETSVAPVQYLKPGTETPSWESDRRRLPTTN